MKKLLALFSAMVMAMFLTACNPNEGFSLEHVLDAEGPTDTTTSVTKDLSAFTVPLPKVTEPEFRDMSNAKREGDNLPVLMYRTDTFSAEIPTDKDGNYLLEDSVEYVITTRPPKEAFPGKDGEYRFSAFYSQEIGPEHTGIISILIENANTEETFATALMVTSEKPLIVRHSAGVSGHPLSSTFGFSDPGCFSFSIYSATEPKGERTSVWTHDVSFGNVSVYLCDTEALIEILGGEE